MQKASNIVAMSAIAVAVLAVGGVHTSVALIVAALAIFAHLAALQSSRERRSVMSFVGAALCLATVLCVVQLVPLPPLLHQILNPAEHALWMRGTSLAGLNSDAWRPLSLDPWETSDRGLRYAALAAIALWASNQRGHGRWRDFARWYTGIALIALTLGFVLRYRGAPDFFGIYTPIVGFRGLSPFISTNHGAVFFGLASIISGASAFALRGSAAREAIAQAVATAVFAIAAVAHGSDGVNLALVVTAAVAGLFQWLRKGRPLDVAREVIAGTALVTTLGLVLAVWLDVHRVVGGAISRILFSGEHGGRLALMEAGIRASADFWRFGAGAGAVGSVVPATLDWSKLVPASIPLIENDPLELVLSFGWPLALLIFAAFVAQLAAAARRGLGKRRNPRIAVACVSAAYVAIVAQLHFPLFALGLSLGMVAWLELLWTRRNKSTGERTMFETGHLAMNRSAIYALSAVLVGSTLAFAALHFGSYADRELGGNPSLERLEREIWLRPGSHAPYIKLASRALNEGNEQQALALTDFAITREDSPRLHLYRAHVLATMNDPRAVDEFRDLLATNQASGRYLDTFVSAFDTPEPFILVLRDLPYAWQPVINRPGLRDDPDLVSSIVIGLVGARPDDVRVYRLAANAYLRMNQPVLARLWAEHADEMERATSGGERIAPLLIARALAAAGDMKGARAVLAALANDPALVDDARREALRMRTADQESVDSVRTHYDALCKSPIPPKDQEICWTTEAWLADGDGDSETAVRLLRLVYRRHGKVAPLARYYLEKRNCEALGLLARRADGRDQAVVSQLLASCRNRVPR